MDEATKDAIAQMIADQVQPLSGKVDQLRTATAEHDDRIAALATGLAKLSDHVEELAGSDVEAIRDIAGKMGQTVAMTRELYAHIFSDNALAQRDAQQDADA
jgi:hypothetical protein